MGTRAYWLSSPWRCRDLEDGLGWTYASTLADIKADMVPGDVVEVQRRTGRKSEGYDYEAHSILRCTAPGSVTKVDLADL